MRWLIAVACLSLAAPASGASSASTLDVQLFHPAPGGNDFFNTMSADVNPSFDLSLGLTLDYARDPLSVQVLAEGDSTESVGAVIRNRLDANLLVGIGLFDFAEIGLVMPLVLQSGYESAKLEAGHVTLGSAPAGFTQGDLRIIPKIRFMRLGDGAVSGALTATIVVPTGGGAAYASESKTLVVPGIALSSRSGPVRLALNAGYSLREQAELAPTVLVDDQYVASLAFGVNLARNPDSLFEIVGEVFGHTPVEKPLGLGLTGREKELARSFTALEGELGLRMSLLPAVMLTVGAGGGIIPGAGAPAPRVFAGIQYYAGALGPPDGDHDGVPDDLDKCPDKPEDRDGFKDDDGCPDLDNDADGVPDEDDLCPNDAEDKDGYQDEDGCPDPDNDGDGLADAVDKCPGVAEDLDGYQDDDGCPDVDNDGDGIPDRVDACPNDAEDKDGYRDQDGCPDPDNDGDGMPDLNDMCPNQAEDVEGIEDDDGCPEDSDGDGLANMIDKCPKQAEDYNGIEDDDGCPENRKFKSLVKVTKEKIDIKQKIFFKVNSAVILAKSYPLLDQVVAVLKGYKNITKIRIEGHTDSAGNRRKNLRLSRSRAESVVEYLVGKGVAADRLEAQGFGSEKPVASNRTARGREMNRRVEFVIVDQKPVGPDASEGQEPEPVIEMPGMDSAAQPPAGGTVPASAPAAQPSADAPLFEVGPGPATPPASKGAADAPLFEVGPGPGAAPAPAAGEAKKGKAKPKGKAKKKDQGDVEFDF